MIRTMSHSTRALAVVALATLAAATGCTAQQDDASSADGGLLPAAEGTTQYPLTIETAVGEIVVDERPERVVMGSSWDGDLFAALGVTPVATDEQIDFYPWVTERIGDGIETLWPVGDEQYPAETIAATSPDLIVDTLAVEADAVERIADVAPVLGGPAGEDEASWRDRLLLLGEVLDLSERAQAVIDEYDAHFAELRDEHPELAGATVDFLVYFGAEYDPALLNVDRSDAEELFASLGLAPNPNAADTVLADGVRGELLGSLSADVLLISNQEPTTFDAFFANPLLQTLESVQTDHVTVLDVGTSTWTVTHEGAATSFEGHFGRAFNYGPLAHLELADLLTPLIAAEVG